MQDTLIIDTSNAPCGPGFLPGLRLSEGRFAITRERAALPRRPPPNRGPRGFARAHSRGWGSRRPAHSARLRPPKCRRLSRLVRLPNRCPDPACGAVAAAGGPRVSALPASRHACGPVQAAPGAASGRVGETESVSTCPPAGATPRALPFGESARPFDYDLRSDETTR